MRELDRRLDLLGLGLAAAAALWVGITGLIAGSHSTPLAGLLFVCVATAVVTRHVTRGRALPFLALFAATPVIVALFARRPLIGSGPLSGPLGYANASGALFFISAGAAVLLGRLAHHPKVRCVAYLMAGVWLLIPWWTGALAAALLGTLLPLAVVLLRRAAAVRTALLVGAGLTLVALLTTTAIGLKHEPGGHVGLIDRIAHATLTERRAVLWSDAIDLLRSQPFTGVGPGRFRTHSPTALADSDALWAHNEYLEVAAETGIPGLILVVGIVLWGFARLWGASADVRSVPAVVVLVGAAIHATIDYIWHFPPVPIALAALVGTAAAIGPQATHRRPP
jgi:O-antigen ligase